MREEKPRWEINKAGWQSVEDKIVKEHGSVAKFLETIYEAGKEEYQQNDYSYYKDHRVGMIRMLGSMLENYLLG